MFASPQPSDFDVARVVQELAGCSFQSHLHHHRSVTSTNALALEAAHAGAATGVWLADEQTAGRGRGGHAWHSAAGEGLYLTALVRPHVPLAKALWLSLAAGLAVQRAVLEVTGLATDIRWPNDILVGRRKCGGILVETASSAAFAMLRYAVIGVGINVNHLKFPAELERVATSLARETGRPWGREELVIALLRALEDEIHRLLQGDSGGALLRRFAAASSWVEGKRVRVGEGGGYTGVTAGLDSQGFLRVAGDDGVLRTVLSGGVREMDEA